MCEEMTSGRNKDGLQHVATCRVNGQFMGMPSLGRSASCKGTKPSASDLQSMPQPLRARWAAVPHSRMSNAFSQKKSTDPLGALSGPSSAVPKGITLASASSRSLHPLEGLVVCLDAREDRGSSSIVSRKAPPGCRTRSARKIPRLHSVRCQTRRQR